MDQDNKTKSFINDDNEIDLFYFIAIGLKYKKFIIILTGAVAILSIFYVIFTTQFYASTVKMYALTKDKGGPLKELVSSLGLGTKTNAVYMPDIINSKRIAYKVINSKYKIPEIEDSLSLYEYWEIDKRNFSQNTKNDLAIKAWDAALDVNMDKETELITATVTLSNKYLSKQATDYLCAEVTKYLRNEYDNVFYQSRLYTEDRLDSTKAELLKFEDDLMKFKENNSKLNSPYLKTILGRKTRKLNVMQDIVIMLEKQRELLLIEEVKERPVLNIIDLGEVHDKAVRPQKRKEVIFNTLIGFILAFSIALLKEKYFNKKTLSQIVKKIKNVIADE